MRNCYKKWIWDRSKHKLLHEIATNHLLQNFLRMIARSFYTYYLFASGKTISPRDDFLEFKNKDYIQVIT